MLHILAFFRGSVLQHKKSHAFWLRFLLFFHPQHTHRCGATSGNTNNHELTIDKEKAPRDWDSSDDYEWAEKSIFDAEQKVAHLLYEAEQAVEHAVQDEVNTLFPPPSHDHVNDHHQTTAETKKKQADTERNVKVDTQESGSNNHDLYEQTGKPVFESKKIGAEMLIKAEQAFEHAVEEEVHTFFPDSFTSSSKQDKTTEK